MSEVLRHVIESITPASVVFGERARARVAGAGVPVIERLAYALAAAQHSPRPRAARRAVVVAAGDHPGGDPGIRLGVHHPTAVAARAIADGTAAVARLAGALGAPLVLVDAGAAEPLPETAVRLGTGRLATVADASLGLQAGIALSISLADAGLDVLAIGAIGVGSELATAALLGAALGVAPTGLGDPEAEAAGTRGATFHAAGPLERLAELGGPETPVLAGLILSAASLNVPVILDGHATGAAALAAAAFAPAVTGYLVAAHAGAHGHARVLAHLGLTPVHEIGLGHGDGTGATMVMASVDQVTALVAHEPR